MFLQNPMFEYFFSTFQLEMFFDNEGLGMQMKGATGRMQMGLKSEDEE